MIVCISDETRNRIWRGGQRNGNGNENANENENERLEEETYAADIDWPRCKGEGAVVLVPRSLVIHIRQTTNGCLCVAFAVAVAVAALPFVADFANLTNVN